MADYVVIGGRSFRYADMTPAMRIAAAPYVALFELKVRYSEPLKDLACARASACLAEILLMPYAPEATADWLMANMSAQNIQDVAGEFKQRSLALAAKQGVAGRA